MMFKVCKTCNVSYPVQLFRGYYRRKHDLSSYYEYPNCKMCEKENRNRKKSDVLMKLNPQTGKVQIIENGKIVGEQG